MKVITIVTKTDSFQAKGDVKIFDHITQIVEKKEVVELIRNGHYVAIMNKEFNRIISVEW